MEDWLAEWVLSLIMLEMKWQESVHGSMSLGMYQPTTHVGVLTITVVPLATI